MAQILQHLRQPLDLDGLEAVLKVAPNEGDEARDPTKLLSGPVLAPRVEAGEALVGTELG